MIKHFKSKLPGMIAAVISGIIVGIIISNYNSTNELKHKDEAIVSLVKQELVANEDILKSNQLVLENDQKLREKKISIVNPLGTLNCDLWDIIKFNTPKKLLEKDDLLTKIRNIYRLCNEINSTITSRENYKINNEGRLENYETRMQQYNLILLEKNKLAYQAIEELKPLL